MSQATFMYLCNELRSAIEKEDTVMRNAIPVEQRVALTLWFLATNADYCTIGHLFGVSKPTVCVITKEVCAAILRILLPKYIRVPTGDSRRGIQRQAGLSTVCRSGGWNSHSYCVSDRVFS